MISAVITISKCLRTQWVANSKVKVNTAVNFICCAYPFIHFISKHFTKIRISTPTLNGQQCAYIYFKSFFTRYFYIFPESLNHFFCTREVSPWTKFIYFNSYRMYNIVNSMLDNYSIGTRNICFSGKSYRTLQAV